jgi:tetratricopeptide (TPR) repeat protein
MTDHDRQGADSRDDKGTQHWQQVKTLFEAVVELPVDQQSAALAARCPDDDLLKERVSRLLQSDAEAAERFLAPLEPAEMSDRLDEDWASSLLGTRLGSYELRSVLGSGGMGTVFEALQDEPRRTVALKVVRPGLVSELAFSRFREESELLARLQHPAIAQVIQAGRSQTARGIMPWFALVSVRGARQLVEHADAEQLDTPQRLALFAKVADAVRHAHQRGVIHCDLKPANVLVDEEGHPQVIDFGVARLIDGARNELTAEGSSRASMASPAGTWTTMSPEQLDGLVCDARVDVYALGAVLYELLCGAPPLDFSSAQDTPQRAEVVRFAAPVPPRDRRPQLDPDLSAILLRALAKDPDHRYPSVAALQDDLERQRQGLPVVAVNGGAGYKLRRFFGRHRLATLATALLLITVVAGATGTILNLRSSLAEAEKFTTLYAYLTDMLVEPFRDALDGDAVRFIDVVNRSAEQIDRRFADVPEVRRELHMLLGSIYGGLWKNEVSVQHMQAGWELAQKQLSPGDPELLRICSDFGTVLQRAGRFREAKTILSEALEELGQVPDRRRLILLLGLSTLSLDQMLLEEAEPLCLEAKELAEQLQLEDSPLGLTALNNWAAVLEYGHGDHEQAARLLERVVATPRIRLRDRHPDLLRAKINLAVVYGRTGRLSDCEKLLEEALGEQRRMLSPGHPSTLSTLINLAQVKAALGDLGAAEALREERLAVLRESFAVDAPVLVAAVVQHGEWLLRRGLTDQALSFWNEDIAQRGEGRDNNTVDLLVVRWRAVQLLIDQEQWYAAAEALPDILADHQSLPETLVPEEDTQAIRASLGHALLKLGRSSEALGHLARAAAWVEAKQPLATGTALDVRVSYGRCLLELGQSTLGRACLRRVLEVLGDSPDDKRRALIEGWLEE